MTEHTEIQDMSYCECVLPILGKMTSVEDAATTYD